METKCYELYTLDELSKQVRERAIQDWRDACPDYVWWNELFTVWINELEEMGFEEVEISFSGFWNQGDGASFTARRIDLVKYIRYFGLSKNYPLLLEHLGRDVEIEAHVRRHNHRYVHERSTSACLYLEMLPDKMDDDTYERLNQEVKALESTIASYLIDVNGRIYRELKKEYEEITSDESIAEEIKMNGILYFKSGAIAPEE